MSATRSHATSRASTRFGKLFTGCRGASCSSDGAPKRYGRRSCRQTRTRESSTPIISNLKNGTDEEISENNMGGTTLLVAVPAEPDRPCVLGILFRPRENHRPTRGRVLCDEACAGRHDAWAVRLYRAGEHRPGTGIRP